MRAARRGRDMRHFECRYVHKDGRVVTLTWTGVWSEREQQHFFIGRDITTLKTAEETLVRTNREMSAILEASPAAIFMLDPSGRVVRWTASAERVFGYTEKEAVGRLPPYLT